MIGVMIFVMNPPITLPPDGGPQGLDLRMSEGKGPTQKFNGGAATIVTECYRRELKAKVLGGTTEVWRPIDKTTEQSQIKGLIQDLASWKFF
jgi:hypothetical protein